MHRFAERDAYVIKARHASWQGHLSLERAGVAIAHLESGDTGTYALDGSLLTVNWDRFQPERFDLVDGVFVQQEMLAADLTHATVATIGGKAFGLDHFSVRLPGSQVQVKLRSGTSDIPTFEQVFVNAEYDSQHLPADADNIVDLGANIGLAAVYFGLRYPKARILCVEPDGANFELLAGNVRGLGERVSCVHAAVWSEDGAVNLKRRSDAGAELGFWGTQVSGSPEGADGVVDAMTLSTLLSGLEGEIDILKVDIEGAELEVFDAVAMETLARVKLLAIETHDRFRPGSEAAVRRAVEKAGFVELPPVGENCFFRRER